MWGGDITASRHPILCRLIMESYIHSTCYLYRTPWSDHVYGRRALSVADKSLWNSAGQSAYPVYCFKRQLNTLLSRLGVLRIDLITIVLSFVVPSDAQLMPQSVHISLS